MKWFVRTWIPLAIVVTGLCVLVYAGVQQNYRESLNDPQIQMAEDAASALAHGAVPAAVVPRGEILDIGTSLAPWIAVYDESGVPLESTASLDKSPAKPPVSVLNDAKNGKGKDTLILFEDRVTWQPRGDVRQAIVVVWVPAAKQFVVAGRNMREVEVRESNLTTMVEFAWFLILAATFLACWSGSLMLNRFKQI